MLKEQQIAEAYKIIDQNRAEYYSSSEPISNVLESLLQMYNLKQNTINNSSYLMIIPEIIMAYRELLFLYPDLFKGRVETLDESLKRSIYANNEALLLDNYITDLKNNNPDSFILLSSKLYGKDAQQTELIIHQVGIIIRKKNDNILIEIHDKAQCFSNEYVKDNNYVNTFKTKEHLKKLTNYVYEIRNTSKNRRILINFAMDTCTHAIKQQKYYLNKLQTNANLSIRSFLSHLKSVSVAEYFLPHIGEEQKTGNCFIKNTISSLNYVVIPKQGTTHMLGNNVILRTKSELLDTKTIYAALNVLLSKRLINLPKNQQVVNWMADSYYLYTIVKESGKTFSRKQLSKRDIAEEINELYGENSIINNALSLYDVPLVTQGYGEMIQLNRQEILLEIKNLKIKASEKCEFFFSSKKNSQEKIMMEKKALKEIKATLRNIENESIVIKSTKVLTR